MSSWPTLVEPGRADERLREDLTASLVCGVLPLAMVAMFGWDPRLLLVVIYFDCILAGVQAVAMIARAKRWSRGAAPDRIAGGLFFIVHFGFFTAGFGLMAVTFYELLGPDAPAPNADGSYTLALGFADMALAVLAKPLLLLPPLVWRILRYRRFIERNEGERVTVNGMMGFPYIGAAGFWFIAPAVLIPGAAFVAYPLAIYRLLLDLLETWLRVRPSKDERFVAASTPRGVQFDVRTARPQIAVPLAAGGFFLIVGAGVALFRGDERWTGLAITAFALFWTVGALWAVLSHRHALVRALDGGTVRTVEGVVEEFIAADADKQRTAVESFMLAGVRFSYSDHVITGAFNRTYRNGGPVHHGARLRIAYVPTSTQNAIVRIEVLG